MPKFSPIIMVMTTEATIRAAEIPKVSHWIENQLIWVSSGTSLRRKAMFYLPQRTSCFGLRHSIQITIIRRVR